MMNKFKEMKRRLFFTIPFLVFASVSSAQTTSVFLQEKVDKAIYEHWQNKVKSDTIKNVSQVPLPLDLRKNIINIEKTVLPDKKRFCTQ